MNAFVFRIPTKTANLDELETLADVLRSFTGDRVEVTDYFEIQTSSPRVAGALEALFEKKALSGAMQFELREPAAAVPSKQEAGKKRGSWKPTADGGPREFRTWEVIVAGQVVEKITRSEKELRLAAGSFELGTQLRSPKAGHFRVLGDKGGQQWTAPAADGESVSEMSHE
jgi:hypothetical protein